MKNFFRGMMIAAAAAVAAFAGPEKLPDTVHELDTGCMERQNESIIWYSEKGNAARGNFYIKSEPAGAVVFINEKMIRNVVTPLTIQNLPAGAYRIRAEKVNYARSVDVALKVNEFKKLDLVLEKRQGKLEVNADVPQAEVFLNEQFMGTTPLVVKALDVGAYILRLKKAGYIEFTKQIEVSDLEENRLEVALMKPGPLKVLSVPLEAEIWFDNEHKGVTPMVLNNLSPETHFLELRKEGYAAFHDTITLASDQEIMVEPALERLTGPLTDNGTDKKESGVGKKLDRTFKWVTIVGGAAFAVIVGIVIAR